MTHVAVIIRGQIRTWKYLAQRNISVIKEGFKNYKVDWYFCYPQTETIDESSLRNYFDADDFVNIQILKDENYKLYTDHMKDAPRWKNFPLSYYRQAFFEYHAGLAKRQHEIETGIRYQLTAAFRPDCYLLNNPDYDYVSEYHRQELAGFSRSDESLGDLVGADFHYVAGSRAANIMSFRYLDTKYTDGLLSQAISPGDLEAPQYYTRSNLILLADGFKQSFGYYMIRPNAVPILDHQEQIHQGSSSAIHEWDQMDVSQRIQLVEKYDIDPKDYFLTQNFI